MSFQIALAGKGGTGKTTVAALLIRYLLERNKTPVLAVDADPNANLNEMLGVEVTRTVGEAREEMKTSVPTGMTKEIFMEMKVQEALVECDGFDLIVMGRPEGAGCYCYANSLLSKYLEILLKNYRYVVMDNEAGLEHISRLTTRDVDLMLVVTDPTQRGILTAERIRDLTNELKLQIGGLKVLVNRSATTDLDPILEEEIRRRGLELGGVIPADEHIVQFDLQGRPIVELPPESPALRALFGILDEFFGVSGRVLASA
jgi:CO dehydrogenase maturation factor